jgi:2,4-dienoyl-CoA reductase (NADPH2)
LPILCVQPHIGRDGREEKIGPFDTVILAVGVEPCNDLRPKLEGKAFQLITIGDALSPRKALEAIREGYLAGLEV